MNKTLALAAAASLLAAGKVNAQWVITTVMDGNYSEGTLKLVEIRNVSGGALSLNTTSLFIKNFNTSPYTSFSGMNTIQGLVLTNKLSGPTTVADGGYLVVVDSTTNLTSAFPSLASNPNVTVIDGTLTISGDDMIILSSSSVNDATTGVMDVLGQQEDGTGTNWDYQDSARIRTADGAATSVATFVAGRFTRTSTLPTSGSYESFVPLGANTHVPVELDVFVVD